ncbi:MAG: GNAT family N-acetyltransferase [Clostridia bacterium]|nr:GNAT family N-acetyltransferase [Clostridia bacterium]MDE6211449.1 GNAT family N-acetyltransferase [Clostridia bacterium]
MKHIGTQTIETERLILRRFKDEEAHYIYENWASDNEVTKYLMWQTYTDMSQAKERIEYLKKNYVNDNFYDWAIVLKEIDEPIGTIGVVDLKENIKAAHIGYCIGKKWWHKGITSEALSAVIDFLFDKVGFERIESRHDPVNVNSGRVMKKCGMKYEGTMRKADINNQGIVDCAYYAILKSDRN